MSSEINPDVAFCFLFIALLLGAIVTFLLSRYAPELPYTVVLFLIGIIFSLSFARVNDGNVLKSSILLWDSINPTLLLFIFLPALLFGEAMSLNFHR